jgi:DNA-binding NarL/FixJ family response regulator
MRHHADYGRLAVMVTCVIVDDNERFSAAARRLLENEGLHVLALARTVAEGWDAVRRFRPRLALVDLQIGSDSGLDLARRVAGVPAGERPDVVVMSARHPEDYESLAREGTVVGFLAKQDVCAAALEDLIAGRPASQH